MTDNFSIMRETTDEAPASAGGGRSAQPAPAASEVKGETTPSAKDVAERVYRIFCEELKRERERMGRWD